MVCHNGVVFTRHAYNESPRWRWRIADICMRPQFISRVSAKWILELLLAVAGRGADRETREREENAHQSFIPAGTSLPINERRFSTPVYTVLLLSLGFLNDYRLNVARTMTKNRGKFRSFHGGKDLPVIFISNAFPTGLIVDSDFDGDDTLPSKVWTSGWYVLGGEYLVLRSASLACEVEWVLGWFNIFNLYLYAYLTHCVRQARFESVHTFRLYVLLTQMLHVDEKSRDSEKVSLNC